MPVFGVDDNLIDGPQQVAITADATGIQNGLAFVTVTDFESFDLQLSAPAIFENGDTATLTLTRDDASVATTVTLSASDASRLAINPPVISFAAGQLSANAVLAGIDNDILDGTTTITVTTSSDLYNRCLDRHRIA